MKPNTKLLFGSVLGVGACLCFSIGVAAFTPSTAYAAEPASADVYDVIRSDSGEFVGVNLKNPTGGAFKFGPISAAEGGRYAGAVFELGSVPMAESTGLLIQLDNPAMSANQGPSILMETSDKALYNFSDSLKKTKYDEVFIKADGTADTFENTSSAERFTFKAMAGTLYLPWSRLNATGSTTANNQTGPLEKGHLISELEEAPTFVRMYMVIPTNATWGQEGRNIGLVTLSTVKVEEDDVTVTRLLYTPELTYGKTADEPLEPAADVDVGDTGKGTKIHYAQLWGGGTADGKSVSFNGYMPTDHAQYAPHKAAMKFARTPATVTLNCVKEGGESLQSKSITAQYDETSNTFPYTFEAPSVPGYSLKSGEESKLQGAAAGNTVIDLLYEEVPAHKITFKFVDEAGKTIRDDETVFTTFHADTSKYSYTYEAPNIFAYEFLRADGALSSEDVTGDNTVTLTYKKLEATGNYEVIYSDADDSFLGVNITNSSGGAFAMASTEKDKPANVAAVAFELKPISVAGSTGILIQFDSRHAERNQGPWLLLEDANGNLYTFCDTSAREDIFVLGDGTVTTCAQTNFGRCTLVAGRIGTLYTPWTDIHATGTSAKGDCTLKMGAAPEADTVFVKFFYGVDVSQAGWEGADRSVAIVTIAGVSVKEDGVDYMELLYTPSLTFTNDAENTEADVNFADMTKGKKVYVSAFKTSPRYEWVSDAEQLATITANNFYERLPLRITLNILDGNGAPIRSAITAYANFENGSFAYEITPPAIQGWTYVSASAPLEGSAEGEFTIDLTYSETVYKITLRFVDENGDDIQTARELSCTYQEYIEIEPDTIEGWVFKEASAQLKFTVMSEKTILLYYTKAGGGCGSVAVGFGSGAALLAVCAGAAVLLCTRKKRTDK